MSLFLLILCCGSLTWFLMHVLCFIANRCGPLDFPTDRKRHDYPIPLIGGLAIYLTLAITALFMDIHYFFSVWVISGAAIVFLGLLDDLFDLDYRMKLFCEILIVCFGTFLTGIFITDLGFHNSWIDLILEPFSTWITILAIVGLMNAFNMIDGIDGLATGYFLVGIGCLLLFVIKSGVDVAELDFWVVVFTSSVVFFFINVSIFSRRKVFLGDSGSLLLGFILSGALIFYSQGSKQILHPISALFLCAFPVYDMIFVIFRRLMNGLSPFRAGRDHLHHLLIDHGFSAIFTLVILISSSLLLNLLGNLMLDLVSAEAALWAYALGLGAYVFIAWALAKKRTYSC